MKEEAPNKKMPPKFSGGSGSATSTPTRAPNDEILSSLLRINNFDSISSIKDESLDIDLSACVTISGDSAMMINGNSLSTTDFWRVLDESAQNSQLDITMGCDDGVITRHDDLLDSQDISARYMASTPDDKLNAASDFDNEFISIKLEQQTPNSFSGTFLRPEPPPLSSGITFSPIKKIIKTLQQNDKSTTQQQQQPKKQARKQSQQPRKTKLISNIINDESKMLKPAQFIKQEPPEQLLESAATSPISHHSHNELDDYAVENNAQMNTSPSKFKMFMLSSANNYASDKNETATNDNVTPTGVKPILANTNIEDEAIATTESTTTAETKEITLSEKLYKCVDCDGMLLKGAVERSTHELAGHHVLFKCNVCVRDFEQEAGLKKHLKTHRAMETRKDVWKKCPDCGKCLKLGSMWMHRKIHTENKKYGCDICGQKFVQKINLTQHSRVHTAEKPYECPECQKRFQERSHLYRHQKYHAQTRSYRCEKCGKMYKTERCLKVHNLVHLEQRPFACTVCDKSFISNSKLKQHSNIHTGERPFKCNYCPRDFTNFPNWLKHTRRRHKVDHKTGEQLENIPSYCSKKSAKPAQAKKTTTATTTAASNKTSAEKSVENNTIATSSMEKNNNTELNATALATVAATTNTAPAAAVTKPPVKRRKKATIQNNAQILIDNNNSNMNTNANQTNNVNEKPSKELKTTTLCMPTVLIPQQNNAGVSTTMKAPKIKRERKQATPKQVQKAMNPPSLPAAATTTNAMNTQFTLPSLIAVPTATSIANIKREIIECNKPTITTVHDAAALEKNSSMLSSFNDLHCLSITSAEELIMEQALELEESGLFDPRQNSAVPAGIVDTDNAVSANETAAALHFKVKREVESDVEVLGIKEEEFISLKDNHKRVLCSSLESSPYSSPASIELCSVAQPMISTAGEINASKSTFSTNSPIYLMPANFQIHSSALPANVTLLSNTTNKLLQEAGVTLVTQRSNDLNQQLQQEQPQMQCIPTQALLNQLYLPTLNGNSMLLPLTNNQTLPSVDTLLFSAAAAAAAASCASTNNSNNTLTTQCYYRNKSVTSPNIT